MSTFYAFLITTLAGLSTLIGVLPIYIKKRGELILKISLVIASITMIYVSVTDLLPNAITLLKSRFNTEISFVLISVVFIIGAYISKYIDKGTKIENNSLYRVGVITTIGITLHNILEGIATYITSTNNIKLGIKLATAITIHNIPEGLSIALPIYHSTKKRGLALLYTFISGFSEFIGALLSYLFLSNLINDTILALLYGMIAGIMTYIAFYELIPILFQKKNI